MAKEATTSKLDPVTEIFQMRAQEKKAEICKQMWHERWSWLIDENKRLEKESNALKARTKSVKKATEATVPEKNIRPVPVTTSGFYGWLATKPDCRLETHSHTSCVIRIPIRAPDAWDDPRYLGPKND